MKKNKDSQFLLYGDLEGDPVSNCASWLISCNTEDEEPPDVCVLYINSPGGDLHGAFSLIELIRASNIPVKTIALGQIASAALMVFCAGTKGYRVLTPTTSCMAHNYSTQISGSHSDLMGVYNELKSLDNRIAQTFVDSSHGALTKKQVHSRLLKPVDCYIPVDKMIEYGLADYVGPIQFPNAN